MLLRITLLAAALLVAGPAMAADEEIQVYMDEMSNPGQVGLDVHLNYVGDGTHTFDYAGEQDSLRRVRITPEWSYGVTRNLELGLYLPLTAIDSSGHVLVGGAKARLKFIAPKSEGQGWFWGANLEVGRVRQALDINPWNAELKGIYGFRSGRWTVAVNANLDWTISGPQPGPATLEIATKVGYRLGKDFSAGFETYNGVGEVKRLGHFGQSDQSTYAVIDTGLGKWDLNFGVGHGYGASSDGWVVKAVVGVPIGG